MKKIRLTDVIAAAFVIGLIVLLMLCENKYKPGEKRPKSDGFYVPLIP